MAGEVPPSGAHIGRFRIPFPLDFVFSIIMLPVLFLAAGVSIPIGWVRNRRMRKQERLFTNRMRSAARLLSWEVANRRAAINGTWIEEYDSFKGPYRLWWSPDDLPSQSPHPCCFERIPWAAEDTEFFRWCHVRYTDPEAGTALLVDHANIPPAELKRVLAEQRTYHRCVSIGPAHLQP
jgi:hypothetical protein